MTVAFETYQYLYGRESLLPVRLRKTHIYGWTAEKIKSWLSEGMLIFFFLSECGSPAPDESSSFIL